MARSSTVAPPQDLPWEGVYHPDAPAGEDAEAWLAAHHQPEAPTVGVLFYRAQWMSGDLAFVDALIHAIEERGCNVMPVFSFTLRDDVTAADGLPPVFRRYLLDADGRLRIDVLITTLSFSSARVRLNEGPTQLGRPDAGRVGASRHAGPASHPGGGFAPSVGRAAAWDWPHRMRP